MSTKKITELTPEQEALLDVYVEKYTAIGLSTEPLVPEKLAEAVQALYKLLDEVDTPPPLVIGRGPRECWQLVCKHTGIENETIIYPDYLGNFDAGFLAWGDYVSDVLDIKTDVYELHRKSIHAHIIWPLEDLAICCQRPERILTVNNELHCTDGPALYYGDGSAVWSINGTAVTEQIVMRPETQTIADIHGERDSDVRMIRIDRFGWLRYLQEVGAELLDERANGIEGTYESLYRTPQGNRFVVTCVTGRIPCMGVPDSVTTCQQAQAYLNPRKTQVVGRT